MKKTILMATWLKLIGSARSPITEWMEPFVGFRKANKPSIRTGDHLFLYAPGGNRRIFALAVAVSDPESDSEYNSSKEGSCQWKLRVRYEINLPVASGIPIGDVSSHRDLTKSVRQQSHIKLLPEESESANSKLRDAELPGERGEILIPEEVMSGQTLPEGAVRQIQVNAYERNREARIRCLKHYGRRCIVCQMTFADVYGDAFASIIHVHHIVALSTIAKEYEVDPIGDLRPVCPNCHAVIHSRTQHYTIEEAVELVAQTSPSAAGHGREA